MLVRFTLEYGNKMRPLDVEALNSMLINGTPYSPDDTIDEDGTSGVSNTWTENVAFLQDLKTIHGLKFKIVGFCEEPWARRLISERLAEEAPAAKVIVPGLGLLIMRKARFLKNPTEPELNEWLTKGWRIIAVIPLRSGRVDYHLGEPVNPSTEIGCLA